MLEEDLTRGEKLYLLRSRTGTTVQQAAEDHKVEPNIYAAWEQDEVEGPDIDIGGLDPHEHYIVLRLRIGKSIGQQAEDMGLHDAVLRRMEKGKGSLQRQIDYWGH